MVFFLVPEYCMQDMSQQLEKDCSQILPNTSLICHYLMQLMFVQVAIDAIFFILRQRALGVSK